MVSCEDNFEAAQVTEMRCCVFQVTRIFCYLTVVTLQYLIPVLLILFSTLALKALGTSDTPAIISAAALEEENTPHRLFLQFNYPNAEGVV